MRILTALVMGVALTCVSTQAVLAAKGTVVLNESGCRSRYVVKTPLGFVILEWFGGKDPSVGDRISGDFETYGMKEVSFDDGASGKVWVEDFWLSKEKTAEKMRGFCLR